MSHSEIFLNAYNRARNIVKDLLGITPENYKVLLFVDPTLYDSVVLQTTRTGTPRAIISSNELEILQELKDKDFVPRGMDLFYGSRNPKIFFPDYNVDRDPNGKVAEAKLVHTLAKAIICENTKSHLPDTLERLYRNDTIIYNLFQNNVYEFVLERSAPWVWQYFQDFSAVMRTLSLYNIDDFYVPPVNIRSASIFYNYLLEIKDITKKRSNEVLKAPLLDLVIHGFGDLVLEKYLEGFEEKSRNNLIPMLKSNLGQPIGVIGKSFLREYGDDLPSIMKNAFEFENDYELTKIWSRKDTKLKLEKIKEELSNKSIVWHNNRSSYWSDLWPLRANQFDKISTYVGKIQRRGYKQFSDLLYDKPIVRSHGRVQLVDRDVAVMSIQEDTVGQEQLLILRNHLQARKGTFTTPLPGLPDIIIFKKFSGMHVASYLGITDKFGERRYPKSPYDIPLVVRAIQVTKRKDAYISKERDDAGKIETANYENLEKLTEPQHRAIRYLIRQGEINQ